ncbi:MAG: hypothetical protein K0S37_1911 [Microbacterium sp.]|nr:hypothetical protein [Microbacterium sp.]
MSDNRTPDPHADETSLTPDTTGASEASATSQTEASASVPSPDASTGGEAATPPPPPGYDAPAPAYGAAPSDAPAYGSPSPDAPENGASAPAAGAPEPPAAPAVDGYAGAYTAPPAAGSAAPVADVAPAYGATPYGTQGYPAPSYGTSTSGTQGYAGYGTQGYGGYAASARTNVLAIVSLVASVSGFIILPFIGPLVGVITGHIGLGQIKRSGEKGRGLALAGVIVGWVSLAFILLFVVLIVISIVAVGANAPSYDY